MGEQTDLFIRVTRLEQENDRLRAENAVLRPRVSELEHRLRLAEKQYHPTPMREDHG